MELIITGIGDKGKLEGERIGLKAIKDCDLKFYQLFKTTFGEIGFVNRSSAVFWFSPLKLKTNDLVVVYTRQGKNNQETKPDGTTTYWIYWGLNSPIFTDSQEGLVLAEITDWKMTKDVL